MTPERLERIREVFDSVLQVRTDQRSAFLEAACGNDAALRQEVDQLLKAGQEAGSFLDKPIFESRFSLSIGEIVVQRYQIVRLLGRGGMGEVYEAKDQLLGETIALKTLRFDLVSNETALKRFQREIQFARKVTHPNVCRVFEVGAYESPHNTHLLLHYFTMQLLDGETLSARIRRVGHISKAETFAIATQMAEGLQAAHAAGVIHRDFKSGNVMLVPGPSGERVVITDFGLALVDPAARAADSTATMTGNQIVGTVAYMSPEQLTGGVVTAASDIYSFGIVLYEMATGHVPFDERHLINAAVQRASGKIPGLQSDAPYLDREWESAIVRCLQPDPKRRFHSAVELANCFRGASWRIPRPRWNLFQWASLFVAILVTTIISVGAWHATHLPYQPNPTAFGWYERGVAAVHATTYEAAKNALEQAVAADPNYASSHAYLAQALDELDAPARAREEVLEALAALRRHRHRREDILRVDAAQYSLSHNFDLAQSAVQELSSMAGEKEKPAASLELAILAVKRDHTQEAISDLEAALRLDPSYAGARLRLAGLYARQRRNDAALESFHSAESLFRAANDFDGVTESLFGLAVFLSRAGRNEDSIPVIRQALAIARDTRDLYHEVRLQLALGAAFTNLGRLTMAEQAVQEGIQKATENRMENAAVIGLLDLGNVYFVRGEEVPAESYFEKGLAFAKQARSQRNESRALLSLGSLRVQYDRPQEAVPYIQKALVFYEQGHYLRELTQGLVLLGGAQDQVGQLGDAEKTLRLAVLHGDRLNDPEQAGLARGHLSDVLEHLGRLPEALTERENAVALYADLRGGLPGAYGYASLAHLHARLGQYSEAVEALTKAKARLANLERSQRSLEAEVVEVETEIAYSKQRWKEALALARRELNLHGSVASDLDASVLAGLAMIRSGEVTMGLGECQRAIRRDKEKGRLYAVAAGELALAEALSAKVTDESANALAQSALNFFEPLHNWEAVWRCHRVLSGDAKSGTQADAVRAAIQHLRQQWLDPAFTAYANRPDIKGSLL